MLSGESVGTSRPARAHASEAITLLPPPPGGTRETGRPSAPESPKLWD
jgi:hypothetical protein